MTKHKTALRGNRLAGLILAASVLLPAMAHAQQAPQMNAPQVRPGYQVPRLSSGKPDLSGVWTNATSTNLERAREQGDKLILTDAEMEAIERETFERNQRQNARTPKEIQDNWDKIARGPDTLDECRSGSRGPACGYNAGWTDPGDWVMRVNGQGRTSLITYPANGRMPPRVRASCRPARKTPRAAPPTIRKTARSANAAS